ncbi:MAG TPA: C4-type zinc ribbon domain-containing protein [Actinomycetota bacterium]|nr:C4-type zinc ribbon domain-containing protein [Actinomycetota bacterium]
MPSADPAALSRLLDLQAEDTAIKRLEERRASLPEAQRLADVNASLAELDADLAIARKQHDEVAREVARLEGESGLLDQKIAREEQRMFSGGVSNPKELSALQAEVESLKRKKTGLEDELLEAMLGREQAASTIEGLTKERDETAGEAAGLTKVVDELSGDISGQLEKHSAARREIAADVPADLLKLYETLRAQKGGVGAAALEAGTCLGCHTKLPQRELERMRAEGGLQRCDNCRRILIVD